MPSLREYAARWGITPERVRPGQKVMHPGPINRGVEIDGRVADSPDSLISSRSAPGSRCGWPSSTTCSPRGPRRSGGGRMTLFCRNGRSDASSLAGRLAGGECVRGHGRGRRDRPDRAGRGDAGACSRRPSSTRTSTCATPGREDEETIASGTAAAAAGGYCAILAMPNTDPVVDSAAVLGSLIEAARRRRVVPTGFMAAISKRSDGDELTEMAELADAGAAAFTDDGRPVASAGLMRRALQYGAVTGRKLALHCEEPTLSRDGQVHEGAVSRRARLRAASRRWRRARWSSATSRSPATRGGRST